MQYEDEIRSYNFLSGFLFGALLGAGVALLARPRRGRLLPRRSRQSWGWRRPSRRWWGRRGEGMLDSFTDALSAGRKRLRW